MVLVVRPTVENLPRRMASAGLKGYPLESYIARNGPVVTKPIKPALKTPPKFASEKEAREYWETHDSTAHLDWSKARKVVLPNLRAKRQGR
jgi:hypothetical protein